MEHFLVLRHEFSSLGRDAEAIPAFHEPELYHTFEMIAETVPGNVHTILDPGNPRYAFGFLIED
jgi:hypothetical protein